MALFALVLLTFGTLVLVVVLLGLTALGLRHAVGAAAIGGPVVLALSAAAFLGLPALTYLMAERRAGWVDADHNGFMDGFANGDHDWMGICGPTWARYWALGAVAVGLLTAAASFATR